MGTKKAKNRQVQGKATRQGLDADTLVRRAESALMRGEADLACDLLSQVRCSPTDLAAAELRARAYITQLFSRWDKPGRALSSIERAIEAAPDRADLRRLHGNLLWRLGRVRPAAVELAEAQRRAGGDGQIAFEALLARMHSGERGGDIAGLAASLEGTAARRAAALLAAVEGDLAASESALAGSQDPVDSLMRGVILLAQRQAEQGIAALEGVAATEQLPGAIAAYANLYLGIARAQTRQLATAANALEKARSCGARDDQVRPCLAWVYQQLAIDAVLNGDLSGAAAAFQQLAGLGGPEAVGARENAAYALSLHGQEQARAGNYDAAAGAWSRALAITPRDAALRQNLAVALERAGRKDEAIPHWQDLVRQLPRAGGKEARRAAGGRADGDEGAIQRHVRAVAHRHLADLYLDQHETERAIEQMERALQAVPSDVETHRALARLLMEEGQMRKSLAHFEQVVAIGPAGADDHLDLGLAHTACQNEQLGIEHMEKALGMAPDNPSVRHLLGRALAQRARTSPSASTALDDAQRALDLLGLNDPFRGPATLALGAVQWAQGETRRAQKTFNEALKLAVDRTAASVHVGQVYWDAGERDLAIATWNKAMKKAAKSTVTSLALARTWGLAGDFQKCEECLSNLLMHDDAEYVVEVVKEIAKTRQSQPALRQMLHRLVAETEDLSDRVRLAEALICVGDWEGASTLLRSVAREAVKQDDADAMLDATDLDYKYNYKLLDKKTAGIVLDWMEDRGGAAWED
ncbi:MAG: tetratricopeptide repeat protein [Chloroflexi bacterium]|nr:tetratricopeptide repeat protein [Chloroflexota bacterium]